MQAQSFGYWLKRRRKALDLTQAELASQVGCSAAAIRKMEAEERRPSSQIAERLAEIFNVPQDEQKDFLRFARGDWKSVPRENRAASPWRASTKSIRSNIPATTTSLIARGQEIALVREYLSDDKIHLVTLIGPPGIGKTRLSLEVARASLPVFPDGVFLVALALLNDSNSIASTIIQTLGYMECGDNAPEDQLKESIGHKQMLIVLDNCEHLIEEIASIASSLLSACPRLKMLATSRESLRIPGEWLYAIPTLGTPEENVPLDLETASKSLVLMLFAERAVPCDQISYSPRTTSEPFRPSACSWMVCR